MNGPLWSTLWQATGGTPEGMFQPWRWTIPLFALAWIWLTLELLTWGRLAKPVLAVVLLVSAAVSYPMLRYGVLIDREMLVNVLQTDSPEALELVTLPWVLWTLAIGALPAWLVLAMRVRSSTFSQWCLHKLAGLLIPALLMAVIIAVFYASYASLFRNHRQIRLLAVPSNMLAAAHSYSKAMALRDQVLMPIGIGAYKEAPSVPGQARRPRVMVLVVGETARAANFQLLGYERPTNPALARREGLMTLGRADACGTSTAVSLPCMFLDVGRAGYETGLAQRRESALDLLQRLGVDVLWVDNNSGCKGVCDRVRYIDATRQCGTQGCFDEVLVPQLKSVLAEVRRDTLVVLHMKGQHGPAYWQRYPPDRATYLPVCENRQLDRCSRQAIVNAYDNAIQYTDHVLDSLIATLSKDGERYETLLMYVSDHGESLGERGIYLHGMPYAVAPREKIETPVLAWMSDSMATVLGVSASCIEARARTSGLSHDHVFHTMLGPLGVRGAVYDAQRDLFARCSAPR